jgi:Sigma-70, region 4
LGATVKLRVIQGGGEPKASRSTTINLLRESRFERERARVIDMLEGGYPADVQRPRTRGECVDGPRPCPFVSCEHHLYLDALGTSLKINFPDIEPYEMRESCVLDIADREGATLEEVGECINLTRERVRQVEEIALEKVKKRAKR